MRRSAEIIRSTLSIQRESSPPVAADLRSLSDEVLALFRARLLRQMIQVRKKYREIPNLLVQPGQIRQVLVNVIGNAVDAMPTGGVLTIGIAPSKLNQLPEVRMLICDSGHGIEREKRGRVFEPFFTTKGHSGSGIGLWVSKQILEKHGGEIQLRSCQGKELNGTCVRVSLPIRH
jgi:signal transduction histidine kinase